MEGSKVKLFKNRAGARHSRSVGPPAVGLFLLSLLAMLTFAGSALSAQPTVPLGNAESFGALSFTAMTNAGQNTVVYGDIGSSTSIHAGVTHPGYGAYGAGSPQLFNAQASLLTAYGFAEAQTPNQPSITGVNLAGMTLAPGVYNATGDILISGPIALTLDGGGDPNSVFIFQAPSSGNLTVDPTSTVAYRNGAQPCNVFWKVNSAWLKNTDMNFVGTILALTQITLTEHITVDGRLLARNADVTFIHDVVNKPTCSAAPVSGPPPPGTTPPPPGTIPPPPGTTQPPVGAKKPVPPGKRKTPKPRPKPPVRAYGLTG
jgi:hypothetical protein